MLRPQRFNQHGGGAELLAAQHHTSAGRQHQPQEVAVAARRRRSAPPSRGRRRGAAPAGPTRRSRGPEQRQQRLAAATLPGRRRQTIGRRFRCRRRRARPGLHRQLAGQWSSLSVVLHVPSAPTSSTLGQRQNPFPHFHIDFDSATFISAPSCDSSYTLNPHFSLNGSMKSASSPQLVYIRFKLYAKPKINFPNYFLIRLQPILEPQVLIWFLFGPVLVEFYLSGSSIQLATCTSYPPACLNRPSSVAAEICTSSNTGNVTLVNSLTWS